MSESPCEEAVDAWVRLVRVEQALLGRIEADLKTAGFPPLPWYDVLLELAREANQRLRPVELERRLLLPQSNMSRLIDRMEREGYVRREACPSDGRGQWIAITAEGTALKSRMWPVYRAAIAAHVGSKICPDQARTLSQILSRMM